VAISGLYGSPTRHDLDHDHDHCDDEQQVNQRASHVKREESEQPQNDQNTGNDPKHRFLLRQWRRGRGQPGIAIPEYRNVPVHRRFRERSRRAGDLPWNPGYRARSAFIHGGRTTGLVPRAGRQPGPDGLEELI
jgi:hypothetical protein